MNQRKLVTGLSGISSACGGSRPLPAGFSKACFSVSKNISASNLPYFPKQKILNKFLAKIFDLRKITASFGLLFDINGHQPRCDL